MNAASVKREKRERETDGRRCVCGELMDLESEVEAESDSNRIYCTECVRITYKKRMLHKD